MAKMKIHSVHGEKPWFCKKKSYCAKDSFVICNSREIIPFNDVNSIEEVDVEERKTVFTKKNLAGLGLFLTFNVVVSLLSGLMLGKKEQQGEQYVTFFVELKDGRRFIATLEREAFIDTQSAIEDYQKADTKQQLIEEQRKLDFDG
jgi:hypothetical protein